MFGLGKNNPKDPLADPKAAKHWLASFPANDSLAPQQMVLLELGRLAERTARRTPSALEAVFYTDAHTTGLRKTLAAQYIEHANRSSKVENQLWQALFDMTQGFLICYGAFAREIADHPQDNRWQSLQPELIVRQTSHLGLDAKIRLYRYEHWIPAKWAELHALFSLACARQIERRQIVVDDEGRTTSIEREYLVALVLQLVNSGNLTPKHVEWMMPNLHGWCRPLKLTMVPSSVSSFYVDLDSRAGLKRRTPAPLQGRVLFLDTFPLHTLLMQNVAAIKQKIMGDPLSEKTPRRTEQLDLAMKLAAQVNPEFKPFARHGERTPAAGTVDAIVGFANIAGYLREAERSPDRELDSGKSFGGTMEIAVFGRMRNERDRQAELTRRRLAAFAAQGGAWEVKDVSRTGFRLLAPMSAANAIPLGALAAIRPQGQAVWSLGIVRWMRRPTADRVELGLQVIANALVGVDLVEQRKPRDSDYSVDGESTTANGRSFNGLFLALQKQEGSATVQSLIVPSVEYQPTKHFKVETSGSSYPIRFGRLLEQQPEWVWAAVEPLPLGVGPTSATAPAN